MKPSIVFLTQSDPIYIDTFFEEFSLLLKSYPLSTNLDYTVLNLPGFSENLSKRIRRFFSFYGPIDFLTLLAKYFQAKILVSLGLKENCFAFASNFLNVTSLGFSIFADLSAPSDSTIFISVSCPNILSKSILQTPRSSFVNIHCAPLPRYKGMMPNFWQMLNDEVEGQVTLHEIDTSIDTGQIIDSISFPYTLSSSLHENMLLTKRYSAHLLYRYLHNLLDAETATHTPKPVSYFSFPTKTSTKLFRINGKRFF